MSDAEPLTDRLTAILAKTKRWSEDAAIIKALADKATTNRSVSEQQLVTVEETSAAVYAEIAAFRAMVAEHGQPSELEEEMIAEVGDVLRLLSLEITELSTRLYAAHSAWALDDGTPTELPEPRAGEGVWR